MELLAEVGGYIGLFLGPSLYDFLYLLVILLIFKNIEGCLSRKKLREGNRERTFIMLKPDAVQRGLVGEIIKRFEQKGFKLVAMKMMHASVEQLEEHYADLKGKGFFPGLIKYMNSGPVVPMVWEGLNVVKTGRVMLGETNPAASAPGTIRGDFSIQVLKLILENSFP